jgi:hypothetical protein
VATSANPIKAISVRCSEYGGSSNVRPDLAWPFFRVRPLANFTLNIPLQSAAAVLGLTTVLLGGYEDESAKRKRQVLTLQFSNRLFVIVPIDVRQHQRPLASAQ